MLRHDILSTAHLAKRDGSLLGVHTRSTSKSTTALGRYTSPLVVKGV